MLSQKNTCFFSLFFSSSFLPSSLFPSTYRPSNFSSILRARCSAVSRPTMLFNVRNIPRWSFQFFSPNFFILSACGISFHFKKCARVHTLARVCFALLRSSISNSSDSTWFCSVVNSLATRPYLISAESF